MPPRVQPVGQRPDGTVDFAACRAAAAGPSPTEERLRRERTPLDRPAGGWRAAWRALWRRVRFRWRYRDAPLESARLRPEFPADRAPDCARCGDNCCTGPNLVSLRLVDIARLHDAGLGWAMVSGRPTARLPIYEQHPELKGLETRDSFRRFPVLQHSAAGQCVFLDEQMRCSVYPIRPLVCRRFPISVRPDLQHLAWSSGCRSHTSDPAAQSRLVEGVVENHNEKLADLALMDRDPELLQRLGLAGYLPGQRRAPSGRFAEVLQGRRDENS